MLKELDRKSIERVLNGEREAFSELVERHQKPLLRLILRMVRDLEFAEDIVQEAFIKSYKKLATFEGRSSFKSWLFQIGINTMRNKLRSKHRFSVNIEHVHMSTEAMGDKNIALDDLKRLIKAEVDHLPVKQKTALMLRVFEDMSFKEVAEVMDCPYDTAKANYRHALMKLRHRFDVDLDLKIFKGFQHKNEAISIEI